MSNFNINPVHLNPQTEGSTFTFSNPVSPYQLDNKAYLSPASEGSSFTFSGAKQSGFQYILTPTVAASGVESQAIFDTVTRLISRTVHETLGSFEAAQTRPLKALEFGGLAETIFLKVSRTANEFLGSLDIASKLRSVSDVEGQAITETVTRVVSRTVHETLGSTEVVTKQQILSRMYSCMIQGQVCNPQVYSTAIRLQAPITSVYSTRISGLSQTLVGATATGGTYVTPASGGVPVFQPNPFNPTVAIHGTTLFGPVPIGDVSNTTVYINIPNSAIDGIAWNQLYNYGFNLDYSGGSFNIVSIPSIGSLGQTVSIFGLHATITATGPIINNQSYGYVTSGIFGNPRLNKQMNLSVAGQLSGTGSLTSTAQFLNQPVLPASMIAQSIATLAGVSLNWAITDIPVINFSFEAGMSALSALNSLAGRCGGVLRWDGNSNYVVAYPTQTFGSFTVPSVYLISAAGIEGLNILDLETGIGGAVNPNTAYAPNQGMYSLPAKAINPLTGLGISPAPLSQLQSSVQAPKVEPIATVGKVLTVSDPIYPVPLPPDFLDVYVQILVKPGSTSFASMVGNIVTDDPNQWFPLPAPGLGIPGLANQSGLGKQSGRIQYTFKGNTYAPNALIDYTLFPVGVPPVDAGNFVFSVGITRRQLQTLNGGGEFIPQIPVQFIKVFQGTINCAFFGVIPLPGMLGTATVDSTTVSGVIETVSFTPPGLLSIGIAQYRELRYNFPWPSMSSLTS